MSKLYFRYGAMNSGKSTDLIQVAYNYKERDQHAILLKPAADTKSDEIVSRIGQSMKIDHIVEENTDLKVLLSNLFETPDCILVDEAQFLTPRQIEELFWVAVTTRVPIICYGLRTDFRGDGFPGADRLLQLAHSVEERKTICRCGKKAVMNARFDGEKWTREGDQVGIDDGTEFRYEAMCGNCYITKVGWSV